MTITITLTKIQFNHVRSLVSNSIQTMALKASESAGAEQDWYFARIEEFTELLRQIERRAPAELEEEEEGEEE